MNLTIWGFSSVVSACLARAGLLSFPAIGYFKSLTHRGVIHWKLEIK